MSIGTNVEWLNYRNSFLSCCFRFLRKDPNYASCFFLHKNKKRFVKCAYIIFKRIFGTTYFSPVMSSSSIITIAICAVQYTFSLVCNDIFSSGFFCFKSDPAGNFIKEGIIFIIYFTSIFPWLCFDFYFWVLDCLDRARRQNLFYSHSCLALMILRCILFNNFMLYHSWFFFF